MEHKYFSIEEINNFKNLFTNLIEEFDLKNDGIYPEEDRDIILLKIVSSIFNDSVKNNNPNLSEKELKEIQGSLLVIFYECLEQDN